MGKKRKKNINYFDYSDYSEIKSSYTGVYSTIEYPEPDGKSTRHCPRRNNPWGNLIEEDTYTENFYESTEYDYSDSDYEDDHDNYYSNSHYD